MKSEQSWIESKADRIKYWNESKADSWKKNTILILHYKLKVTLILKQFYKRVCLGETKRVPSKTILSVKLILCVINVTNLFLLNP